jgi:hypothetical protein
VRPHDDLRRPALRALEVRHELEQRLGHVPVALVPRHDGAAKQRAVVALGVDDQARVLLGEEPRVGAAVAQRVPCGLLAQLDELCDDLALAGLGAAQTGLVGIHARVAAEPLEAGVALASALRRRRVGLAEVGDDGLHRGSRAVEVQSVEAGLRRAGRERIVVLAQPRGELGDRAIAPHPRREAAEVAERVLAAGVVALAAHPAVDAPRVRPVRLGGDRGEPGLGDQPARDLRALAVEVLGAVRRVADEDERAAAARLRRASNSMTWW